MNVAGPERHGPGDDLVHQTDDWRIHAYVSGIDLARSARNLGIIEDLFVHGLLDRLFDRTAGAIVQFEAIEDVAFRSAHDFHRQTGQLLERVDGHDIARIGQRDRQGAVLPRQQQGLETFGRLEGHELEHGFVDHAPVHVDHLGFGLLGDERRDDVLRDETEADHDLADEAAAPFLLAQCEVKLCLGDVARFQEPLAQALWRSGRNQPRGRLSVQFGDGRGHAGFTICDLRFAISSSSSFSSSSSIA